MRRSSGAPPATAAGSLGSRLDDRPLAHRRAGADHDTLNWSHGRSQSLVDAVDILCEVTGARIAPTYLLNPTGDLLVLIAGQKTRESVGARYDTIPAHEHLRDPWTNATRIRLEVTDDGNGFDPSSVPDSRLGAQIMSERMQQVDGEVRFEHGLLGGTPVVAEPLLRPARDMHPLPEEARA